MVLMPLTGADPFLPVSHDFGPVGPAVGHCQMLRPVSSLLAAYDACATPKEQEMLLSTIKCGHLQR